MFCGLCRPQRSSPVADQKHAASHSEVEAPPLQVQMARNRSERVLQPITDDEEDIALASRSRSRSQSSLLDASRRRLVLAQHEVRKGMVQGFTCLAVVLTNDTI